MHTKSIEETITKLKEEKDAVQRAKLIHYLHVERALSLKEISTKLDLHASYISHYLRILQLPNIVLDGYYAKQISSAHLFILSRLKNEKDIVNAYQTILAKNLTSAQTEELIREIKFTVETTNEMLSKEEKEAMIEEIRDEFPQVEIKIIQTRVKGKIVLELTGETAHTTDFLRQIKAKLEQKILTSEEQHTIPVLK